MKSGGVLKTRNPKPEIRVNARTANARMRPAAIRVSGFGLRVLPLVLMLLCIGRADAAVVVNEVAVTVMPRPTTFGSSETHHGYMEYRVALVNQSQTEEKTVRLTLPASSWGSGDDRIYSIRKQITLAPGTSSPAIVSLIQPPIMVQGDGLEVQVGARQERVALGIADHIPAYSHSSDVPPTVLTSQDTDNALRTALRSQLDGRTSGTAGMHQSEVPIEQWSSNWLNYTRYDGVVLSDKEIKAAPIDVVEALRRYTMAGGTLIVTGDWTPPRDWRPHGFSSPGYSEYHAGLGVVFGANTTPAPNHHVTVMANHINQSIAPWKTNHSVENANRHFPVVDDLQVPVKGLLILMIGFAVLIGPVNLWVLGKYKKRMWLLWTVPTFSLLTCLAVWVYATAAEGWSGHERTKTLTILDQKNWTATTIGWAAFYAPITPGGGLSYDLNTELTPQIGRYSRYYGYGSRGDGRSRTLNLDQGQHLANGWIVARVPAHFQVRKTMTNVRPRLNFRGAAGGNIEVVNGLGVPVSQLTYADDQGNVYTTDAIPTGQAITMNKTGRKANANHDAWRWIYQQDWVGGGGTFDRVAAGGPMTDSFLRPGTYVAVLEAEPLLESGLGKPDDRRSEAVILGYAELNATGNGETP